MVVTDLLEVLLAAFQVRIPVQHLTQARARIQERAGQGQVDPQICHRDQCLHLTRVVRPHSKHPSSEEAARHLEDQVDHLNEEGGFTLHAYIFLSAHRYKEYEFVHDHIFPQIRWAAWWRTPPANRRLSATATQCSSS